MKTEHVVVIYHKDCIDGTTSAAVTLRKFPHAKLFPLGHVYTEDVFQEIIREVTPDSVVYTVDCAIGIDRFLEIGCTVITLDHHIGIKEELETYTRTHPHFTFVFDNERSGASITWNYFFPDEPVPEVIALVEDADLWRFKYGVDTKYVNTYLSMFRNNPAEMLALIEGDLGSVKEKGAILAQYADREIGDQVQIPTLTIRIGAYNVRASNVTVYESAVGNALSQTFGETVALFTVKSDMVRISFRSAGDCTPSALELATILGGGGHIRASGASVPLKDFIHMIVL